MADNYPLNRNKGHKPIEPGGVLSQQIGAEDGAPTRPWRETIRSAPGHRTYGGKCGSLPVYANTRPRESAGGAGLKLASKHHRRSSHEERSL